MIDLVIDPRDPELKPLGPSADGSSYRALTVTVAPSRVVRLAAGGFLWDGAPVVVTADTSAPIVVNVPATDGTEILAADRLTFVYVVTVEARSARHPSKGVRNREFRGLLPTSLGATVQVTALVNAEPVPPQYVDTTALFASVAGKPDLAADGEESATKAARANDARFKPRAVIVPDGTDFNTLRDPHTEYIVPSAAAAQTMINWVPTPRAGSCFVAKADGASATTQLVITYTSTTLPTEVWTRGNITTNNASWSQWATSAPTKGVLPSGTNADTWRNDGPWLVTTTADKTGLPPGAGTGLLRNFVTSATALSLQTYTERVSNSVVKEWRRFSLSTGGWTGVDWELALPPATTSPAADVQVSDHATRVEYARARRGGVVGTNGAAVVMLRFDHWLVAFRDKVLPIMRTHSLPGTLNVNYDNIGNSQNGGGAITWSHVQDWNQYDGIEIANHGATHTDASTRASIYHEIVEGRRLLETAMPRVAVETWHEHGSAYLTASDIAGDPGLNLGRTPSSFTESYAGRLVMAEHAVVEGKCGGFFVPLNGTPQIGQSHYSIDQSSDTDAIAQVDNAKTLGRGVTLYVHPGLLDTVLVGSSTWAVTYNGDGSVDVADPAGTVHYATVSAFQTWATSNGHTIYMRSAHFEALCAYLATERAAGRVMVMTAAGGAFADKSHARRENLLVKSDFTTGYTSWWTGLTGWTIATPGAGVTLSSSASPSTLTQAMLMHARFGWAMGAAHELVVRVKAGTATNLTLTVEKLGDAATWQATRTFAIPGDNVERDYRLNLSLPRDPNITQMSVKIGGASLTIVGPPRLVAI